MSQGKMKDAGPEGAVVRAPFLLDFLAENQESFLYKYRRSDRMAPIGRDIPFG